MKKSITREGLNGTFKGTVEVKFCARKKQKTVTHAYTHDDSTTTTYYHKVFGYIEGKGLFCESNEFTNKEDVFLHLAKVEKEIEVELHRLATTIHKKTVEQELRDMGYL